MNENESISHSTLDEGDDFFITDTWNKKYHFKVSTFAVPSGLFSEAIEVLKDNELDNEPRVYHILSDFDSDIETAELHLKEKIKKGINKRYLDITDGEYSMCSDLELAGRIQWDDKLLDSNFNRYFAIDGKKITVEKFIDMLEEVEGWNFKFKIFDTTDDID